MSTLSSGLIGAVIGAVAAISGNVVSGYFRVTNYYVGNLLPMPPIHTHDAQ